MLTHRAHVSYFLNFLYILYFYFFGRDSGGTNPDNR